MAGKISNDLRDQLMSAFRGQVCRKLGIVPFEHQMKYWCAADGLTLHPEPDPAGVEILIPEVEVLEGEVITDKLIINQIPCLKVLRKITARSEGRARFLTDLGSFKIGKSFGSALFYAGFAAVPGARVSLVGIEYDLCEPEFNYLVDFLLSESGMNLPYDSLQNRPRDGKMWIDLPNGMRYDCKSWERKDSLKGKEIDCYGYCEAYMLPGPEALTSVSQNLRARRGYALFPTTPDRPWLNEFHKLGHGEDPEWECTCGTSAEANPYTFDPIAKERDRKLMTREKFAIHYDGQLGDFVGHVFNFQRGSGQFSAGSHPDLFRGGTGREHLVVPEGWEVVGGADTGTFYSALLVAFSPEGDAFVLDEFPNYRYVAGASERDESISIPGWAATVVNRCRKLSVRPLFWADKNTQFKYELLNYGVTLLPATVPVETRTEIAREYFEHRRIFLAPWLQVLPFEIENAQWPDEATLAGKFARLKDRDHTLDPLEHILARRPQGKKIVRGKAGSWAESVGWKKKMRAGNVHLGV